MESRYLYNPTTKDFSTDVDKYGDNPENYTLKAGAIEQFPDYVCDLLEDKIIAYMLWKSPPANKNYSRRKDEIREIIRVNPNEPRED